MPVGSAFDEPFIKAVANDDVKRVYPMNGFAGFHGRFDFFQCHGVQLVEFGDQFPVIGGLLECLDALPARKLFEFAIGDGGDFPVAQGDLAPRLRIAGRAKEATRCQELAEEVASRLAGRLGANVTGDVFNGNGHKVCLV